MAIQFRLNFGNGMNGYFNKVDLNVNPGWATCWNEDSEGNIISEQIFYYPSERVVDIFRYNG